MKDKGTKTDWNSKTGKPNPKQDTAHEADPLHADVKHDEPLGRVGIAPSKPMWPSKE